MKLFYHTHSTYNPGGMERVLLNKVVYLVRKLQWEITIVTTDQHGRSSFYPFPKEVRMVDLDINYSDDNGKNVFVKIAGYLRRRRKHRKALTALLMRERPDVVVSLYPSESSFIPDIADGSKKVLELHYCKFFRLQYNRKGLLGLIDRRRTRQDEKIARRFDRFVVLTQEDKGYWGDLPNISVIPNAAMRLNVGVSDQSEKRIIAVGRLDYQKGFDRLIRAWAIVQQNDRLADWHLDIFGQGEWRGMLCRMIKDLNLERTATIHRPTSNIGDEYVRSSLMVMSSHYEGFPMVMIEAMACGVPVVSFDFKCGPRDIIDDGVNGRLVENDNVEALANAMTDLMTDEYFRKSMAQQARKVVATYSEEAIMKQWTDLFKKLF